MMTNLLPLKCRNCGDLLTAYPRPCPFPAPGGEFKETGRGGHMFISQEPAKLRDPLSVTQLQTIAMLSKESTNECICLCAAALDDLLGEYDRLRAECKRLRGVILENAGIFTPEQIAALQEVTP